MKLSTLLAIVATAALAPTSLALAQPPPPPGPPPPCVDAADIQFVCGQQGPEDLVVVPGGTWVVTGIFGGSGGINLIRVSDRTSTKAYPAASAKDQLDAKTYPSCPGPPDVSKFTTHGLSLLPGRGNVHRLFVVGHGGREAIEVFELDARPKTPVLKWIGCAIAADPIGLNSVRGLPDGGFITSNFLPRGGAPAATQRMMAGELWEWHTASGWQKVPGSEAAGANGLEMSADGKTLYVAAWGSQSFFRLSRGLAMPKHDEIPLGFRVDNIRWARDGSILAAGQGEGGTVVVKVDPRTLAVKNVLKRPAGNGFGAGTVAVEVGGSYWIGSFAGDRIAIVAIK
jgi:hypothetical protein